VASGIYRKNNLIKLYYWRTKALLASTTTFKVFLVGSALFKLSRTLLKKSDSRPDNTDLANIIDIVFLLTKEV
jgi:hypothetical protein